MKFYFVLPHTSCDIDELTIFIRAPQQKLENIGLEFDSWPLDDLFQSSSAGFFCTDRLKCLLETDHRHFTGIMQYNKISRISTGQNWKAFYKNSVPDPCWQVVINGTPLQDDIGIWSAQNHLVVSERLLHFLGLNHVSELNGQEISGDIKAFFEAYEANLKVTNYASLPEPIFDIKIRQNQGLAAGGIFPTDQ
jgi:hypothetical protein